MRAGGRLPKLTYPKVRQVDLWFSMGIPVKKMISQLGVSRSTVYECKNRSGAYREVPRFLISGLPI